ncbi:hypothetical protein VPHK436_0008 [Vibrio phage K436]
MLTAHLTHLIYLAMSTKTVTRNNDYRWWNRSQG